MKSRNHYEFKLMRKSGAIASQALKKALETIKIGVSELEVDKVAEEEIYKLGGDLSYKSVPGYKYATCITVNEQVVHGIPTNRKFIKGDLVSVDLAVVYKGWHSDCAWSVLVTSAEGHPERSEGSLADASSNKLRDPSASPQDDKKRFLSVGEEALWEGIAQAVDGNKVGDISHAIQTKVEGAGYSVVRSLVGHGIGRQLHEEPEIPGFGKKGTGPILKSGMTLAIEVIYARGKGELVLAEDGWTFSTADKSWGGLFEMTVAVGKQQAEVLTKL